MSPEVATAAIAALATIGSAAVAAFVTWRGQASKGEVDRETAQATSGRLALDIAQDLRKRVTELEEQARLHEKGRRLDWARIDRLESDRLADRERIDHLGEVLHAWSTFYADLVMRWSIHRASDAPPAAPAETE